MCSGRYIFKYKHINLAVIFNTIFGAISVFEMSMIPSFFSPADVVR